VRLASSDRMKFAMATSNRHEYTFLSCMYKTTHIYTLQSSGLACTKPALAKTFSLFPTFRPYLTVYSSSDHSFSVYIADFSLSWYVFQVVRISCRFEPPDLSALQNCSLTRCCASLLLSIGACTGTSKIVFSVVPSRI
jgi:hypothetical protein